GLPGGGATKLQGPMVTVYYDSQCTKQYITASPAINMGTTEVDITETATYYGLNGAQIGSLKLSETIGEGNQTQLYGLGTFTPASGAPPVQLGLYCTIGDSPQAQCGGGIAQDFPSLGLAIGAVTPLTLTAGSAITSPITFSGGGSPVTGPIGSLSLANPLPNLLVIHGGTTFGAITASGGAAGFELFPPTPTGWMLKDTAHD